MGVEVASALILAGATAATTAAGARAQNRAVRRSERSANAAAAEKLRQLEEQAVLERRKASMQADQIRGRTRVAAAASGVGFGGSFLTLERQAGVDEQMNLDIIQQNLVNQSANVRSGLDADLAALAGRRVNTILAGFTGGIQGAETGLRIGSFIEEANQA